MKIGDLTERLAPAAGKATAAGTRGPQEAAGQAKGTHGAAAQDSSSSTVKLSSAASALLEGSDGGFDAEKVQRVRDAIADGTYKINPEAIADKLISNAQELLGRRTGAA